jgi:hypothetical protein
MGPGVFETRGPITRMRDWPWSEEYFVEDSESMEKGMGKEKARCIWGVTMKNCKKLGLLLGLSKQQ